MLEGLRREVREEVGLEVVNPILTRILQQTMEDGSRARHGYFAQFVARATSKETRFGHDVVEGRWFDHLTSTLAFRSD